MNRRGFALLAVLWVLTALSVLAGVALATSRIGWDTTRNRVLLARAEWAREACVEILLARYAQHDSVQDVDTVELGRGTWCRAKVEDPAARLDVNTVDRPTLEQLLSAVSHQPSVMDSVLAARRRGRIYDLNQIGVDSSTRARFGQVLTTRGTGVVNVNAAPRAVLATLPGITEEAIELILRSRDLGVRLRSVDDLATHFSRSGRARLYADYQGFVLRTAFTPPRLVATVEGGLRGSRLLARATLTLVPVPGRLAVIRRETE
jgi:type II secretory pathway component PulK